MHKLLDLYQRLTAKEKPQYLNCLTHRTWLSRQVQEVVLEQERRDNLRAQQQEISKRNWYDKY